MPVWLSKQPVACLPAISPRVLDRDRCVAARLNCYRRLDISAAESGSLVEERETARPGERVGETITDRQATVMAVVAKVAEALARDASLLGGDGNDFKLTGREKLIENGASDLTLAIVNHDGQFDQGYGGDQSDSRIGQGAGKTLGISFPEQDRKQSRGVTDHLTPQ